MAEAPQLDRPGVEVIQEFVETSPTILRPSLQACIVGPCKQVVEAVDDTGLLNSSALVNVPARLTTPFVGEPYEYPGLTNGTLVLAVNNGPLREISLPVAGEVTPARMVDSILTAAISGLTARVETSGPLQRVVVETTSKGDGATLRVGPATEEPVLSALGWAAGFAVQGASGYNNRLAMHIATSDFPDPRHNLEDLEIDYSSIRVFVSPGGGLPREVSKTEAVALGASGGVTVFDDGDGDSLSPYLDFTGADFNAGADVASATGTVGLSTVDYAGAVQGRVLRLSVDGGAFQSLLFDDDVAASVDLLDAINTLFPGVAGETGGSGFLKLTSQHEFGGHDSTIVIDKNASSAELLTALGLTGAGAPFADTEAVYGTGYSPEAGDELWVDGIRIGLIVEVPASPTNRLRVDSERLITFSGTSWYVRAKNLSGLADVGRPGAELQVDANSGTITIPPGMFRSTGGAAVKAQGLGVYVAYDALRLDVTPRKRASDFNLLRIGSLSALEDTLAPVDPQNPLALGMYFALLNAPGLEVTGCGVDEVNAGAPQGTADAYARAFEFLESKDVYTIVPLTHSPDVGSIAATHVRVMSEPSNGLERITVLNPARPSRKSSVLVASGSRGNVSGTPTDVAETGLANLQALLATAGKPGPVYTENDAVYLQFEGSAEHYALQSVSGGQVTINNGPLVSNSDGFYFDGGGQPVFPDMVVDRPFTIAIRGGLLTTRTDEAVAYGDLGRGYRNSRVIVTAPDTVKATLDGLEQAIPGYYAAAGIAGAKAVKNPSQPMTESVLAGFTGVAGSQERYSEPQLRIISGGGLWVLYQEADGQPVRTRQQLTTDVGTLLTRESSITDALDYAAKTLRQTFRNFIGRFNITLGLIEALNLVCDGVSGFFIQNNLFASFKVVAIKQNATAPDELSIIADVETLKPLNKIRITMRVS